MITRETVRVMARDEAFMGELSPIMADVVSTLDDAFADLEALAGAMAANGPPCDHYALAPDPDDYGWRCPRCEPGGGCPFGRGEITETQCWLYWAESRRKQDERDQES